MNTPNTNTPKPGIKTTEFWLAAAFTLLVNVGPLAQSIEGPWGLVANAFVLAAYALSRGAAKKVGVIIPLLLGMLCLFTLPSCADFIPSYTVNGAGRNWAKQPVQVVDAKDVTPNVALPLPEQVGGGTLTVPVKIIPSPLDLPAGEVEPVVTPEK